MYCPFVMRNKSSLVLIECDVKTHHTTIPVNNVPVYPLQQNWRMKYCPPNFAIMALYGNIAEISLHLTQD